VPPCPIRRPGADRQGARWPFGPLVARHNLTDRDGAPLELRRRVEVLGRAVSGCRRGAMMREHRRRTRRPFAAEEGEIARALLAQTEVPFRFVLWRLAGDMKLDPDVIEAKPLSKVFEWLRYRRELGLYENYRAEEAMWRAQQASQKQVH
jgi:hypothetical protein